MLRLPLARWNPNLQQGRNQATARRWACLLGFSLPLSGGLTLSLWIPGYPDQMTIVRLVTIGALLWIMTHPLGAQLPAAPRHMLQAFGAILAYGTLTLLWAPDLGHGLHDAVGIGLAIGTAAAVLLLVGGDRKALGSFAVGVLLAGGMQVAVALGEVVTGRHLSVAFGAEYVARFDLANIEQAIGATAWGSLGNPNDLAGFLLLATAIFLSMGAYGLALPKLGLVFGWGVLLLSAALGLAFMADARAYRLGVVAVLGMHITDRVLTPGRTAWRAPTLLLMGGLGVTLAAAVGGSEVQAILSASQSDTLRLVLIKQGFETSLVSGGFGRGLGTEQAMLDSGKISTNFHNIEAQLAAELGLIVAASFLIYLLAMVVSWAFVTRSARAAGTAGALARATLAVALLVYGVTSSGVLQSPAYWTFFALTALLTGMPRQPGQVESARRHPGGESGRPSSERSPARCMS